jgi:hypothetical protein
MSNWEQDSATALLITIAPMALVVIAGVFDLELKKIVLGSLLLWGTYAFRHDLLGWIYMAAGLAVMSGILMAISYFIFRLFN